MKRCDWQLYQEDYFVNINGQATAELNAFLL